ncbi:MAG: DapH/DapD/GlmU-related protein [Lachnospiraceae bacterium]|nr:DapH/DapD/GlmU-related protein [Lachnospiraceae bacterium]
MSVLKEIIYRIRGEYTTEKLIKMGLTVGSNFSRNKGVLLDPTHCWLIEIGNNVTLAPRVHILCHDASTKLYLGYTKIGRVKIGNNVFVGASSVIMPGVTIGNDVIIGANSTVTKDIPDNSVVVGSPGRIIGTTSEYIQREKENMQVLPCYSEKYTVDGGISDSMKQQQKDELKNSKGFVV